MRWMVHTAEKEGELHIASKAVSHFPERFRGKGNANLTKASIIWKDRSKYLLRMDRDGKWILKGFTITRQVPGGRTTMDLKAWKGRGRKRAAWAEALHVDWIIEFDRPR